MILDGVVDAENYYSGADIDFLSRLYALFFLAHWDNGLRDTDAEATRFYQACVDAGPFQCRMYEGTSLGVETRIKHIVDRLSILPIQFYDPTTGAYGILSGTDIKVALFKTLFRPYANGRAFYSALAALEDSDMLPMARMSGKNLRDVSTCECPAPSSVLLKGDEGTVAIACGECAEVHDGLPELKEHYKRTANYSSFFSPLMNRRTDCA